jgi:hypothetical protein
MLLWNPETIKALLSMGQLYPHLMFVGRHEHELYATLKEFITHIGRSMSDNDVLLHECETNGGISAIRDVLRPFTRSPRHPRPALVVLRHFDRLSPDAQFALRRTMEIDQDKCRCLAASTTTSAIIQPLHSRFVMINCDNQPDADDMDRLFRTQRMGYTPPNLGDIEHFSVVGPKAAMDYARRGVGVVDVLIWLEDLARRGEIPWRVLVVATTAVYSVSDEATGIYLAATTCNDWMRGEPYAVYAS